MSNDNLPLLYTTALKDNQWFFHPPLQSKGNKFGKSIRISLSEENRNPVYLQLGTDEEGKDRRWPSITFDWTKNEHDPNSSKRMINLSITSRALVEFVQDLDEYMIKKAEELSVTKGWTDKKKQDSFLSNFTSPLKIDPNGQYPPLLRTKFYMEHPPQVFSYDMENSAYAPAGLEELQVKYQILPVVQLGPVWATTDKWGYQLILVNCLVPMAQHGNDRNNFFFNLDSRPSKRRRLDDYNDHQFILDDDNRLTENDTTEEEEGSQPN